MTTFHAFLGCSIDGCIAGPDDELDWLEQFDGSTVDTGYDDFYASVGAMVMGRRTYEVMQTFDPQFYGATPIHVLSTSLPPGPAPALGGKTPVVVHPDVPSVVAALTEAGVERAYVDGGRTVQWFLAHGLLSDIVITTLPVVLGKGIPLFGPLPDPAPAELVETRTLGGSAVQTTYRFRVSETVWEKL